MEAKKAMRTAAGVDAERRETLLPGRSVFYCEKYDNLRYGKFKLFKVNSHVQQ